MPHWTRYAVFAVPKGALYAKGAAWLGWDSVAATPLENPGLGIPTETLTARPRNYGFHATLKPPFRLAKEQDLTSLQAAISGLAKGLTSVEIPRLEVASVGRFLALIPSGPNDPLVALGAKIVTGLDPMRAPLTASELETRRKSRLSDRQEVLLQHWGYPYVLDQFRFHMTLTGPIPPQDHTDIARHLSAYFAPELTQPYLLDDLALMGEDSDGRFHLIERYGFSTG